MRKFQMSQAQVSGHLHVKLEGSLTEWAEFSDPQELKADILFVDFAKLKYINSIGIGRWVKFLNELKEYFPNIQLKYINCPVNVVTHINNVDGFLPEGGEVISLEAPFYCQACDVSARAKYISGKQFTLSPPNVEHIVMGCPQCRKSMEFDAIESSYFNFIFSNK